MDRFYCAGGKPSSNHLQMGEGNWSTELLGQGYVVLTFTVSWDVTTGVTGFSFYPALDSWRTPPF